MLASATLAVTALHGLQLPSLGPWAARWPNLATWPTGFHLWILESACIAALLGLLSWHRFSGRWRRFWAAIPGAQRSWLLLTVLVTVQAMLGTAFWLTRDQGIGQLGGLRALFWLGGEFRLPALFAVFQAWLAAWLAWQCHRQQAAGIWRATAMICLYIGLDELLSIHEMVGAQLRNSAWVRVDTLNTVEVWSGVHSYPWQLVFLPTAALVGALLLRGFLKQVDGRSVALLVVAAVTFIGGAIGMETVQATSSATQSQWHLSQAAHLTLLVEESMETLGMSLAICVFARQLWARSPSTLPRGD